MSLGVNSSDACNKLNEPIIIAFMPLSHVVYATIGLIVGYPSSVITPDFLLILILSSKGTPGRSFLFTL